MAIDDDISVAVNGDIRYTGSGTNYTVLEFHRYLQDHADDASAAGDDLLDITSDNPSSRSTDNIINLLGSYNIDDILAQHLYDGSVTQNNGDTRYSGLVVVGGVETGTILDVVQDNKVLVNFWNTGINADAANNIISRMLVKTRENGVDIDGGRVRVKAGELGDKFAEFTVTLGLGNGTAAIFTEVDLNNATAEGTISGWTSISNTEGLRLIDITGDGTDEEYYSEWNVGTQTINDTYERAKWIQKRALEEDSNAETGTNYIVDNATIVGLAQSFAVNANNAMMVTKARLRMKKVGSPTGPVTLEIRAHSGTYGTSSVPTGGALATSETFEAADLTTSYQEIEFRFLGAQQFEMAANTKYVLVILHPNGGASDYVHVEGDSTGTHGGNKSEDNGGWTAAAAEDLWFKVFASHKIHAMSGELFRGITHSFAYDGEAGTGPVTNDLYAWGLKVDYDNEASGPFEVGEAVYIGGSNAKRGRILALDDNGATGTMVLFMEAGAPADDEQIVGQTSGATADVNGAPVGQATGGGLGQFLAVDDDGTTGNLYMQLLQGTAPANNDVLYEYDNAANTVTVNGTVTTRTVKAEFIGTSTGTNIIGTYGIGFESADVTASDQFFDLTNTLRVPPNNVTFTVAGVISGEDRVLVGPEDGSGGLDKDQLTLATDLTGAAETAVVVTTSIPSDTPSSGTIRIQLNTGKYRLQAYTSWTGSTFTIASTDYSGANQATGSKNVFISYIDKLADATSVSFTAVYNADRTLYVRVRDGGASPIVPFETIGTLGSAGGSTTAIRNSDT